jgi:acetamidase/formamidase
MQANRLGREHIHTYWSNEIPPRLTVMPGETVVFETVDCDYGDIARNIARLPLTPTDPELKALVATCAYPKQEITDRDPSIRGGHPLTGPVAIEGAEPGDTLVVELLEITPGPWGWNSAIANPKRIGVLNDYMTDFVGEQYHIWDLREPGVAIFKPGIRVPVSPFPGVIGIAQAEPGQIATAPPREQGGNMDIRHLTAGSTLYLPVQTPGALFSTGDVHAAQGDGEVSGTGIEMEATVVVRFDIIKGQSIPGPQFHTADKPLSIPGPYYATTGHKPELLEAAREALRAMIDHLGREYGLTKAESYMLCSACVDLKISQIVDLPNYTVSAYLPLSIFG